MNHLIDHHLCMVYSNFHCMRTSVELLAMAMHPPSDMYTQSANADLQLY